MNNKPCRDSREGLNYSSRQALGAVVDSRLLSEEKRDGPSGTFPTSSTLPVRGGDRGGRVPGDEGHGDSRPGPHRPLA